MSKSMDNGRKRRCNRRNNCRKFPFPLPCEEAGLCGPKSGGFLSGLCSFLILSALMALIYLMLEYHCTACRNKCDMTCVTKNIENITKNLSHLKDGYHDLEIQISKFSQELPRLHGQLEVLETLANTLENSELGWNPRNHYGLPNVDVYLTKTGCDGKNASHLIETVSYNDVSKEGECPNSQSTPPAFLRKEVEGMR